MILKHYLFYFLHDGASGSRQHLRRFGLAATFCVCENSIDPLIINNNGTKKPKSNKIKNRSLDHLATTTNTSMSQSRAAVLTPPSSEPDKACHSRACYSR
jgi:hypothetical protein